MGVAMCHWALAWPLAVYCHFVLEYVLDGGRAPAYAPIGAHRDTYAE